ncbi:Small RNA 2'-O-methyltransferase [Oryzias melastigma]|uniref:Small RNA 2'-O-methyltransferase n=1 Tax=Oryzias melastigma TaxID=30732 RepID=A0A3B3DFE9_ORYME|nr:small RNA 2'-O-methyltransferase [Oryzias melastigma]KAF6715513.1 Small RNA 2'-O-methyltransferase [Oryzias melastigma]
MEPLFSPALHKQRRQFVVDFVRENKPKKVVDLGCGECSLLKKLRFHHEIELLVGVDINEAKIKRYMHGLAPISTDYLQPSFDWLSIELYKGSVTQRDSRFKGFDLATAIEVIEHLTPADVEHFSAVVFGYMSPGAVVISTPNSDFNPLLPGLSGFRDRDHKFEWSKAEFRSWALRVCSEYGYEVEFTGVGKALHSQHDSVGFCSQIGVFHRLRVRDHHNTFSDDEEVFSYTLLYHINYPSLRDNNTLRRVLVSEVLYQVEQLKVRWAEENSGGGNAAFPLCQICEEMKELQIEAHTEVEEKQKEAEERLGACAEQPLWTSSLHHQDLLNRYVTVPLSSLWSHCPKIKKLSGSLVNLRHLLMNEPAVKLSDDGRTVLVKYQEEDEEEDFDFHLEDGGLTEVSCCSDSFEQEENWETNI